MKILNKPKGLPIRGLCDEGEYTWDDWEEETKAKYPIRFWLAETVPSWFKYSIQWNLRQWYWAVRDRIERKYHKLNLHDKANGYTHYGYSDVRSRLVFANFALLREFVECEMDNVVWDSDPGHEKVAKEIQALYKWWTEERPKAWEDFEKGPWENILDEEYRLEEKDSEMVKRLMDIRLSLWT